MKRVAILGSTGSIGTQALDVAAAQPDKIKIVALAAHRNDTLIEEQIRRFEPALAVLTDQEAASRLKARYTGRTKILAGEEGLLTAAVLPDVDTVLTSMVGFAGLKPTIAAIEAQKTIALANKETMVAAGQIVTRLARQKQVAIYPVDSEHSAIFQCLNGERRQAVKKIILTASGGPFRDLDAENLKKVTLEQCLRHPNWNMGPKVTIDSASLANKGLEVIEARWLFDMDYDQIEVVVHPQSIIHSMVEYIDGVVMAQLGAPDMRTPIQYALSYPERWASPNLPTLDFQQISALSFRPPDNTRFPALSLAFTAGKAGGTMPCVFNAANEVAVDAFVRGSIAFVDIPLIIKQTMAKHPCIAAPDIDDIFAADRWARAQAKSLVQELTKEKGQVTP